MDGAADAGRDPRCRRRARRQRPLGFDDAIAQAGAFSVVLEIVVADIAKRITQSIQIPTIGIGSGEQCDGQILVTHDLIGLFPWFTPKFVSPEAHVAEEIRKAARAFIERTRTTQAMSNGADGGR